MHRFKSAILAKMKNCQNGTFEPVHEIQIFFWPKAFFWSIMKMAIRKFFCNMSQGLPNPRFMQEKVQKGDFLRCPMMKKFSDSTHQECMVFAKIGHGSCYYRWNEIFAGVEVNSLNKLMADLGFLLIWGLQGDGWNLLQRSLGILRSSLPVG